MILEGTPVNYGRFVRLCGCAKLRHGKRVRTTRVGVYVDAKQARLAARLHAVMQRHAEELKRIVRSRLGKADDPLSAADQVVRDQILEEFDANGFTEDLVTEITPDLVDAYRSGGMRAVVDLIVGKPSSDITSQIDQAALDYVQSHTGELITGITDTTLDDLRAFFGESLAAGLDTDTIAVALDDYFAFGESRATMIARTELAAAHVAGNVEGWDASGVSIDGKRWILGDTHPQDDECDDCVDAGVVGVDEDFIDGISLPPAHPNCICDVVPVLADEGDDSEEDDA